MIEEKQGRFQRKNRQFRDSFVRSARKTPGATQDQVKNSFWKLFTRL